MTKLFSKVLIANRGEIACRVMRTCQRLGIRTVAVYSAADENSLHVRTADEAVALGPAPAQESYLNVEKVLAAARSTGADAIHPGYGFLSENAEFAEACKAAGITFIGPPAAAIRAMGSKSAAKALMARAGVPLTPGYHGEDQSPENLHAQADRIGYPVLIKAAAGGGGKGMRRVDRTEDFSAALASCKREAASSFGDDHVLIERYILNPRHIEVQVFADTHGNVLSLFERDCSVQRRHQKVLEEAPAPGMTPERREAMSHAACEAARAVGYVNAGTVEFIVSPDGDFHFMEMNTRLQVEHPVTEMITGQDLVEWQLRVAAGDPLPMRKEQLRIHGHALEARIYAEDPARGFLPSTGRLLHYKQPEASDHVRIDAGVGQDDEITAFYDPMIAKLIVWDHDRPAALERMRRALGAFQIVGVKTNITFLQALVASSAFSNAELDTGLIEREREILLSPAQDLSADEPMLAALAHMLQEQSAASNDSSPWAMHDGWRVNSSLRRILSFTSQGARMNVDVEYAAPAYRMRVGTADLRVQGELQADGSLRATIGARQLKATVVETQHTISVFHDGQHWEGAWLDPLAQRRSAEEGSKDVRSPMPGLITAILVAPGAKVSKGTPLLTMEAMKMEYSVSAPADGLVRSILYAVGDQVPEDSELLVFVAGQTSGDAPV
ncbi:MAG TPA: acetyl/propionyl/methylcrotonyl-CoA carboxylase subunit alpha [Acidobacteriaceae bacterium]|nr:acetyl/propionyl/methylcrotonyl-CoA carboxylase subunit alpha [Acidobacteriaceae bacterium]